MESLKRIDHILNVIDKFEQQNQLNINLPTVNNKHHIQAQEYFSAQSLDKEQSAVHNTKLSIWQMLNKHINRKVYSSKQILRDGSTCVQLTLQQQAAREYSLFTRDTFGSDIRNLECLDEKTNLFEINEAPFSLTSNEEEYIQKIMQNTVAQINFVPSASIVNYQPQVDMEHNFLVARKAGNWLTIQSANCKELAQLIYNEIMDHPGISDLVKTNTSIVRAIMPHDHEWVMLGNQISIDIWLKYVYYFQKNNIVGNKCSNTQNGFFGDKDNHIAFLTKYADGRFIKPGYTVKYTKVIWEVPDQYIVRLNIEGSKNELQQKKNKITTETVPVEENSDSDIDNYSDGGFSDISDYLKQ